MSEQAVRNLHTPVEIEQSDTICGECSWRLPNGKFFGKVVEYPCPTLDALDESPNESTLRSDADWAQFADRRGGA